MPDMNEDEEILLSGGVPTLGVESSANEPYAYYSYNSFFSVFLSIMSSKNAGDYIRAFDGLFYIGYQRRGPYSTRGGGDL